MKNLVLPLSVVALFLNNANATNLDVSFAADLATGKSTDVITSYTKKDPANVVNYVKTAIIEKEATTEEVAQIVKAGILAAPSQARVIYVAALSVAPDAHEEVLEVYYSLVANAGTGSSDAKGVDLSKGGKGGDEVGAGEGGDIMKFPEGNVSAGGLNQGGVEGGEGGVLSDAVGPFDGGPGAFPLGGGEPIAPSGNAGGETPTGSGTPTNPEVEPVSTF